MIPWSEDPNHSGSVTVCGGHLNTTPMEWGFSDHPTRVASVLSRIVFPFHNSKPNQTTIHTREIKGL
jgi:hypothetical protein